MLTGLPAELLTQHVLAMMGPNELTALSDTSQGMHRMCRAFSTRQPLPLIVREEKLPTKMGYKHTFRQQTKYTSVDEVYQIQSFRFLIRTNNHFIGTLQLDLKLWNHVWDEKFNSRTHKDCRQLESVPGPTEVSVSIRRRETAELVFERHDTLSGLGVYRAGDAISPYFLPNLNDARVYVALCGERLAHDLDFGGNYPSPEYLVYRLVTDLGSPLTGTEPADRETLVEWEYRPAKNYSHYKDHVGNHHGRCMTQYDLDAFPWYWTRDNKLSWPLLGTTFFSASPSLNSVVRAYHFGSDGAYIRFHYFGRTCDYAFRNVSFDGSIFQGCVEFDGYSKEPFVNLEFTKLQYELTFDSELACILSATVTGFRDGRDDQVIRLGREWGDGSSMANTKLWDRVHADVAEGDENLELATTRFLGRLEHEGATEVLRTRVQNIILQKRNPMDSRVDYRYSFRLDFY